MRYIVITLILANVLYFGWRFLSPPPAPPVAMVARLDKSQIQLIDDSDVALADDEASATAPTATSNNNAAAIDSTVAEQDMVAVTAASTVPDTESSEVPTTTTTTPSITAPAAPTPLCLITTWTRDEKQLTQWRNGLDEQAIETLTQEVETQRRFLVYIPAKASAEQTLERLREIKKLPIESAHINKGEYLGGISLGLFSQLESAQSVLKQAHDLGITDAKQTVRLVTVTEYRLRRQTSEPFSEPWALCAQP